MVFPIDPSVGYSVYAGMPRKLQATKRVWATKLISEKNLTNHSSHYVLGYEY